MPWFYAGPEAKPVGPISLEELHACRVRGMLSPETYVIEQPGQPGNPPAWKRYKEVFPADAGLPPLPPVPPPPSVPLVMPPPPPVAPTAAQPHPLFPSAAPVPGQYPPIAPDSRPDPYYHSQNLRRTNPWCAWGFWLGLASFILAITCGLGVLLAPIALLLCIIGLVQVYAHREQGGQYQAIWGIVLAGIALILGAIIIYAVDYPMLKKHGLTSTEQTSNDSE